MRHIAAPDASGWNGFAPFEADMQSIENVRAAAKKAAEAKYGKGHPARAQMIAAHILAAENTWKSGQGAAKRADKLARANSEPDQPLRQQCTVVRRPEPAPVVAELTPPLPAGELPIVRLAEIKYAAEDQNSWRKLDELMLSTRADVCLRRMGIWQVGHVLTFTEEDLRKAGMGRKSLREVKEILAEMGKALKTTPQSPPQLQDAGLEGRSSRARELCLARSAPLNDG